MPFALKPSVGELLVNALRYEFAHPIRKPGATVDRAGAGSGRLRNRFPPPEARSPNGILIQTVAPIHHEPVTYCRRDPTAVRSAALWPFADERQGIGTLSARVSVRREFRRNPENLCPRFGDRAHSADACPTRPASRRFPEPAPHAAR